MLDFWTSFDNVKRRAEKQVHISEVYDRQLHKL